MQDLNLAAYGAEYLREFRDRVEKVPNLRVRSARGAMVPAGALASVSIRQIGERAYQADVLGEVAASGHVMKRFEILVVPCDKM